MPSLGSLCEKPALGLRFLDAVDRNSFRARAVLGVWLSDPESERNIRLLDTGLRDLLVIVAPDQPWLTDPAAAEHRIRILARSGAAGLAIMRTTPQDVPETVLVNARKHGVPLLVGSEELCGSEVAQVVSRERLREYEDRAQQLEEMLDQIRRPGRQGHHRLQTLLDRLAKAVEGSVRLVDPHKAVLTSELSAGGPLVEPPAAMVERIVGGEVGAASINHGKHSVRLYSIGYHPPHMVLIVVRDQDFNESTEKIIARSTVLLSLLIRAEEMDSDQYRLQQTMSSMRAAVLHLALNGLTQLAQEIGQSLYPGLFSADQVRVHLITCGERELNATASKLENALRQRALVVRSPFRSDQLFVVTPEWPSSLPLPPSSSLPSSSSSSSSSSSVEDRGTSVVQRLHDLVADVPGLRMGASHPKPLANLEEAHREAHRALTMAGNSQEKLVTAAREEPGLSFFLDPGAGQAWAEAFLRPLDALAPTARESILRTIDLSLRFSRLDVAKATGSHRNTVAARIAKVSELLALDLSCLPDRAVLSLALELRALPPHTPHTAHPANAVSGERSLGDLLADDGAQEWARIYLGRLDADRRELRRTLAAWVAFGGNVEQTAQKVGVHLKTVRNHLRAAESLLNCRLLGTPGHTHDLVLAMHALGVAQVLPDHLVRSPSRRLRAA
ncbi:helix-turn-helix domain-containing protein [Streptomyces sp. 110]|uniref:Helix-turn-helix domain-containing protein n=1 Tax=Streptomyces endocoffeicus TaxID=2898945 RepID=A0ABS1QA02_9ACTN|nr:helix-turn-helix domain-containing protein [Streptomyces endocoffeicus]MBL1120997.1 helix-turn-helix domain-containing protein [Streptomyces endocoffeicus]